jgi:hypothetical protein
MRFKPKTKDGLYSKRVMMKFSNTIKTLIFTIAFGCLSFCANAWGVLGHRIVGEIAEQHLSANAKKAVKGILGNESMAMVASWADFIRSDVSYKYLNNWHYVNLPEGLSKNDLSTFLEKSTNPNIYNKTNEMIAVLKKSNSTADEKKFALKILIHLIGDMHQPMHTARKIDLGGNKIQLTWFGQRSNLHRVWDEQLIDFQQLSYTEYVAAINLASAQQIAAWQKTNLKDCIYESYQICNHIYASGMKANDRLSYNYNFDWAETLNSQLLKGGVRLAGVLNKIFAHTSS